MKHRIVIAFFTLLELSAIWYYRADKSMLFWISFAVFLAFSIVISVGVIRLKTGYFLSAISTFYPDKVLLTFDDGPDEVQTPVILDLLRKYRIAAVFFVIGEKVEKNPELIRQMIRDGHMVGNHTYSHDPFFSLKSRKTVDREIQEGKAVIERITGKEVVFFRPPVGYTNPIIARSVNSTPQKVLAWSVRSFDTVYTQKEKLKHRLVRKIKPGSVVLLHDPLRQVSEMLPELIAELKNSGILFADPDSLKQWVNNEISK